MEGSAIAGGEKFKTEQTLVCLLHACKGYKTTVELKDESSIFGNIGHVDGFMNIKILQAKFTRIDGNIQNFDEIFIQGNKIRFVHIPDEIDIRKAITEQISAIKMTRNRPGRTYRRGRGRGRGRGTSAWNIFSPKYGHCYSFFMKYRSPCLFLWNLKSFVILKKATVVWWRGKTFEKIAFIQLVHLYKSIN